MSTAPYKSLDRLEPSFRRKVDAFLENVKKSGIDIIITETWRSDARQAYLRKLGLSKVVRSNHQDGKAIDIAFEPKKYGSLYPNDDKLWRRVANIGKKYKIDWGFDLWNWDKPHFQDNGVSLALEDEFGHTIDTALLSEAWINILDFKSKYNGVITDEEQSKLLDIQKSISAMVVQFKL